MNKAITKTFFSALLLMGLTAAVQACVDDTECLESQWCSSGVCCADGQSFCAYHGRCIGPSEYCGCRPDASCNTSTCVGSTCTDSCGNVHNGIKTPDCGCAVDTCTGGTCGDGCGGTCDGTLCCASCTCAATTCTGSTCADGCGGTCDGTLNCSVSLPVINSALSVTGTVGTAFSYLITATNSPTSFNATNLPAGLSVNIANGLISGTPSAAGVRSVTLGASNGSGTGTATLSISVSSTTVVCTCPGPSCGGVCSPGRCVDSCGNAGACVGLLTCTVEQQNAPGDPLSGAHAYPTPYKPSVHGNGITFNNLNNDPSVHIKIYTIKGELIQELHNTGSGTSVNWNVTNKDGQAVASGVYVYRITNNNGKEKKGKLLIAR